MSEIAVKLGLPHEFVQVRHDATHRELPSLEILRSETRKCLEWIWDNYWSVLSKTSTPTGDLPVANSTYLRGELAQVLKEFLSERIIEVKSKTPTQQVAGLTVSRIKDLIGSAQQYQQLLAKLLVESKLLLPSKRRLVVQSSSLINYAERL
jgi:ribosomal biogenesis protein LAS1